MLQGAILAAHAVSVIILLIILILALRSNGN
jgi:hypothetical protein